MDVAPPYDILELADGESRDLTVTEMGTGSMVITPRDGRPAREIRVTRLTVPQSTKAAPPDYWDVTSQLIQPTLQALLSAPGALPKRIRITKSGSGPSSRLSVTDLGHA